MKHRQGSLRRVEPSGLSAICQGMFKKESDLTAFVGMKVTHSPLIAGHHLLRLLPPHRSVVSDHEQGKVMGCDPPAAGSSCMPPVQLALFCIRPLLVTGSEQAKWTSLHPGLRLTRLGRPYLVLDAPLCVAWAPSEDCGFAPLRSCTCAQLHEQGGHDKQSRSKLPARLPADVHNAHGIQVTTANGETGTIDGNFGKSGRFRVSFPGGIQMPSEPDKRQVFLTFKTFVFDQGQKRMAQ